MSSTCKLFSGHWKADSTFFWDLFWDQAFLWCLRHHGVHSSCNTEHSKLTIGGLNRANLIQHPGNIFLSRKCILNDCIFSHSRWLRWPAGAGPPFPGLRHGRDHAPFGREAGPLIPANLHRKCLEFRFRFREWTLIFFFFSFLTSFVIFFLISTSTSDAFWANSPGLHRKGWLLRLRSLPPHRSLRLRNLRPPEKKMTPSWENLVELWQEGKKPRKVNSQQNHYPENTKSDIQSVLFNKLYGFRRGVITATLNRHIHN